MKRLAGIILHYHNSDLLMQLRDDKPMINYPNQWGLFGGGIEAGETPLIAAIREIEEELTVRLDPAHVHPVGVFYNEPKKEINAFHYLVTDEMDNAVCMEGQRFGRIPIESALSGTVESHTVVPHLRAVLEWFVTVHLPNTV